MNLINIINKAASRKELFTAGPASLLEENLLHLSGAFGRGDDLYSYQEEQVLNWLSKLSGKSNIARLQGSSTLAIEIALRNFISGSVLVVETGYYAKRLGSILSLISKTDDSINIEVCDLMDIHEKMENKYDWVVTCFVETSMGYKFDPSDLLEIKRRTEAKLFLDSTASIGLENDHYIADVHAFSSCKGLFGLTGASFIAFADGLETNEIDSFYLDIKTHLNKNVTGPYHSIQSLYGIMNIHHEIVEGVKINKLRFLNKFKNHSQNEPLLCTMVDKVIKSSSASAIMYEPRSLQEGMSIVCHIGEAHLKSKARGDIQSSLYY